MGKVGGKGSRERTKKRRSAEKRTRKDSNYKRLGPKAGRASRAGKAKGRQTMKPGVSKGPIPPTPKGPILGKRHEKLHRKHRGTKLAKRPLKPLRRRWHLGSQEMNERKGIPSKDDWGT